MTDYTKSTNFATKDSLSPGSALKIVRGTEIDTEFNNIATAVATKANSSDVTSSLATKTDNSSAAITGGTINGSVIGGITAAAASFTTLSATGVTTVQAGTVSAPAITTSGDTNTGIFFPAADTIAFTRSGIEAMRIVSTGEVTYTATTLASYQWTNWNPTNLTGTVTNAPSTGTTDDSNYVTMVNASGTLTITFDVAGKYFVSIGQQTSHAQVYSFDRLTANLGGTATRRIQFNPTNSGVDSNDSNFSINTGFYITATAAQTLTILPTYELTGGGTTAQHTASCSVTIQYCGG